MQPVKVFLASSKEDGLAAETFESELKSAAGRANVDVEVCPWYREDTLPPGVDYLSWLIAHCKGSKAIKPSDFFVVILPDKPEYANSCIFELGLFLGGLGFEAQRCFMISTTGDALPDGIRGYSYIPFTPPANKKDPAKWTDAMKEPATLVRTRIKQLRACAHSGFQVITAEMLMDLESPREDCETGQLTDEAEVVVNRAQPIEENQRAFAARVLYNMKHRVKYRYFFHDKNAWPAIARLIHALATVVPSADDPKASRSRGVVQQAVIIDNLKVLQQQLSINLIPSPGPIEFCVHNVNNPAGAVCYLRYPFSEKFIQWCERQSAIHVAQELIDLSVKDEDLQSQFVFRSTKHFDMNSPENHETKKRLWNAICQRFVDDKLNPLLREVCFERLTEEETDRWNRNLWDDRAPSVETAAPV